MRANLPLQAVALAKAGQVQAAIGAYDRALELEPNHADARYNRDLLQQFLEDNPQEQQPEEQAPGEQGQQGDSEQSQSQSGEQQEGEQASDEQGQQGEQQEEGESQAGEGAQEPDDGAEGEPQDGEESSENANAGDQPAEGATETAPGPEEVEQWASEQAAEQWLRRVPQDPGGLLRRKFLYQYQRQGLDQDGNRVLDGTAERQPW